MSVQSCRTALATFLVVSAFTALGCRSTNGADPVDYDGGSNQNQNQNSISDGGLFCGTLNQACCFEPDAGLAFCTDGSGCVGGLCVPRPTETGTPCERNADCGSGICLPIGGGNVCTTACGDGGDCVPGWTCEPMIGQQSDICQCSAVAESCDGNDNNCDGFIDEGAPLALGCAVGENCSAGSCTCAPSNLCAGVCVDLQVDAQNCGSCGTVCPGQCEDGQCAAVEVLDAGVAFDASP